MSEENNKPPTGPEPDATPKVDIENLEGKELKAAIKQILSQNAAMASDNKEMKEIITKQETEREIAKFDKLKDAKLEELKAIKPYLAEQHKDTKDLGTIQTAIDTAKTFEDDFQEIKKDDPDKKKKPSYVAPSAFRKP